MNTSFGSQPILRPPSRAAPQQCSRLLVFLPSLCNQLPSLLSIAWPSMLRMLSASSQRTVVSAVVSSNMQVRACLRRHGRVSHCPHLRRDRIPFPETTMPAELAGLEVLLQSTVESLPANICRGRCPLSVKLTYGINRVPRCMKLPIPPLCIFTLLSH